MAFNNVPVNGWPQIKDLEKLNAIASQIENMPTFTSDDRAFLEDLPAYPDTDGTKMLTATTTGGNTSLSYEDIPEELPAFPQSDGEKVLTATTTSGVTALSWENKASAVNYSTTEQETGQTWIDGNKVYRKVISFQSDLTVSNSSWTSTSEAISDISTLISVQGVYDDACYPLMCSFDSSGVLSLIACRATSSVDVKHIIVDYTKTPANENRKRGK